MLRNSLIYCGGSPCSDSGRGAHFLQLVLSLTMFTQMTQVRDYLLHTFLFEFLSDCCYFFVHLSRYQYGKY